VGQERLGPSYFFISLVLGFLNSLVWYVPSLRYTRGLGWCIHCGVEVTESSTNKQHHHQPPPAKRRQAGPTASSRARTSPARLPAARLRRRPWRNYDTTLFQEVHRQRSWCRAYGPAAVSRNSYLVVCFYYCSEYYKALRAAWGKGDSRLSGCLYMPGPERCVRLLRGIATGTYKIKTRGSRLGSLYYNSTNLTMNLLAALACDIDVVVEGAPVVVVVGAREDGLAVRGSVLTFILPGVPAAGVHQRTSHCPHPAEHALKRRG
jgi:hypothetical protein